MAIAFAGYSTLPWGSHSSITEMARPTGSAKGNVIVVYGEFFAIRTLQLEAGETSIELHNWAAATKPSSSGWSTTAARKSS